ncbi:MAG: hypothetical protein A2Y10_13405 [Planctomycetes bacterium GWF2_41_51]|nr:MAG: hypothetical protein A2Y10_13405 [Planctomycetes bacterium GWF2_41_51]HBG26269.1 hypothetical protein [Phycisphaerales bacterium]
MNKQQLAVQIHTIRDYLGSSKEIEKSLQKIKAIGFNTIELFPYDFNYRDIRKILDDTELTCCSMLAAGDQILSEPEKVLENIKIIGAEYLIFPYPRNIDLSSEQNVIEFAKKLNKTGEFFKNNNVQFAYHNHSIEFQKINSNTIFDMIYSNCNPDFLKAEIDCYWVHYGGGNILEVCEKLTNRMPLIHLKDYAVDNEGKPVFAEVGKGNLNFCQIIKAASKVGCKWFIVEQDQCYCNPFDALKYSYNYILELK